MDDSDDDSMEFYEDRRRYTFDPLCFDFSRYDQDPRRPDWYKYLDRDHRRSPYDHMRSSQHSNRQHDIKSSMAKLLKPAKTVVSNACYLHEIDTSNGKKTIFEAPDMISDFDERRTESSYFNIVMVDVSASMKDDWDSIEKYWNSIIASKLYGLTKIFIFGARIELRRVGTRLCKEDFRATTTNLTEAIERIRLEIEACYHLSARPFIRVFLITDGHHNTTPVYPPHEIKKLFVPPGKTVEVFLLGLKDSFPVDYSMSIRSLLHNGSTNVPSLFWAKETDQIESEMHSMADVIRKGLVTIDLTKEGWNCPEFPSTRKVHLGEFLYFDCPANELKKELKLTYTSERTGETVKIDCDFNIKSVDARFLLDKVFRQWNSVIIQTHRKQGQVPQSQQVFKLMEDIYKHLEKNIACDLARRWISGDNCIATRLLRKYVKVLQNEFATLMNQSKMVVGLEGKFKNEMELAETILMTTVKSKFNQKNLKMKGRKLEDYDVDMEEFLSIYNKNKEAIMSLPDPSTEESCNITFQSPILDLKDDDFLKLVKEDKFTFMKTFAVTGIPIYVPVKDASQINAWALCIRNILVNPYNIVSQTAIELSAQAGGGVLDKVNKGVMLQADHEESRLNAIIPVFSKEVATVLKPLVRSKLFGMLNTFCILKDPHVIDMNAHMAALGCAFIKTITDFPSEDRPEFIKQRIQLIEDTAQIYLDRRGYKLYANVLSSQPKEALMTESKQKFDEWSLKCESLVKATFFLYLYRSDPIIQSKLKEIIRLLVIEFIGRNVSKYKEPTPYSDFFVPALSTEERRKERTEYLRKDSSLLLEKFIEKNGPLLENFFTIESLLKKVKLFTYFAFDDKGEDIYDIKVCIDKVKRFHSPSSAGHLYFRSLKILALEVGLAEEDIEDIFEEENIFTFLYHALKYRNSSERLSTDVICYKDALENVSDKVVEENLKKEKRQTIAMVLEEAKQRWTSDYLIAHKEMVKPMTVAEIVEKATQKGVDVTLETFNTVFRFVPKSGLLRNACMVTACPHFLKPSRSFNQHIWFERKNTSVGHLIHKVARETADENGGVPMVMKKLLDEDLKSSCKRKTPPRSSDEDLQVLNVEISGLIKHYFNNNLFI